MNRTEYSNQLDTLTTASETIHNKTIAAIRDGRLTETAYLQAASKRVHEKKLALIRSVRHLTA